MEYLKLNNDVKMPVEGLGTFLMSPAEAEAASLAALEAGYKHIDTANAYMNEKAVGRAIAKSGVARDKLFVSTKLWPSVYEAGDAAIESTLSRLGLDYVDMLILHQPVGNYLAAWKTMEKAYKEGKVRALGLSNFPQGKIAEVIDHAEIKPQLVTVECHPYFAQSDLREYLSQYGIVIEAWYPLGHGDKGLQEEPVFTKLAEKYGKTAAQVILRWHVQMGTSIIPGSKNPMHIADNADIFDFELTDEEMTEDRQARRHEEILRGHRGSTCWLPRYQARLRRAGVAGPGAACDGSEIVAPALAFGLLRIPYRMRFVFLPRRRVPMCIVRHEPFSYSYATSGYFSACGCNRIITF